MRYISLIIMTILLLICSPGKSEEAKKEADNKYFYILNYSFSNAVAEIEFNGVPVAKSRKEFNYSSSGFSDIGQWIFPGENTATLRVSSIIKKEGEISAFPNVDFSISIAKAGQMSNEGKKIISFCLPECEKTKATADATIKPPFEKKFVFVPDFPPPSELWSKAKQMPLDEKNKKLITKLISDYHSALAKKDLNKLYGLLLFRVQDLCRLRHFSPEQGAALAKADLKEMLATKGFAMEPMNVKKLVFRPLVDGKVIWITIRDEEEPLQTKKLKDSGKIAFAVYVAYIDGKWTLVR